MREACCQKIPATVGVLASAYLSRKNPICVKLAIEVRQALSDTVTVTTFYVY
jgi:hypothetical protein